PVPAHGRLLAPACAAPGGTEEIALARSDLRHPPQRLREDRGARRGAEALHQARVPAPPPARRRTRARCRPPRHGRLLTDAADAARAPNHPSSACHSVSPPTRRPP